VFNVLLEWRQFIPLLSLGSVEIPDKHGVVVPSRCEILLIWRKSHLADFLFVTVSYSEDRWITNVLDQNCFVFRSSCKDIVVVKVNAADAFSLFLKRSHNSLCCNIPEFYFTTLISNSHVDSIWSPLKTCKE